MKKQIEMIHTTFLEKHGHKKLIINRYFVCTVLSVSSRVKEFIEEERKKTLGRDQTSLMALLLQYSFIQEPTDRPTDHFYVHTHTIGQGSHF